MRSLARAVVARPVAVTSTAVCARAFAAAAAAGASTPYVVFDERSQKLEDIVNKPDAKAIAYFTASWCGPCRAIAPHWTALAEKHGSNVTFIKIDVDDNNDTAADANISAVPTFQAYVGGKKVKEFSGAQKEALSSTVDLLIASK